MINSRFIEDSITYFSNLPNEKNREYEKAIAHYADQCRGCDNIDSLYYILEQDLPYAYEAFFTLCTIYRRSKDFEPLRKLLDQYSKFKRRISYNHLVVQYLVHSESFYDYDDLLTMAYRDAQLLNENAGYLQAFCNAFATICERCNDEDRAVIVRDWYAAAIESIDRAIELDPDYAKFYCTKARILALNGSFSEVNNLINTAISKENSARKDYVMTVMNYQYHSLQIALQQQRCYFEEKLHCLENIVRTLTMRQNTYAHETQQIIESEPTVPQAYSGQLPYVFVSYAHRDQAVVFQIIADLQKRGMRIWYDRGIVAGAEWPEAIANHLLLCNTVLIMLSLNSLQSANVRREVNLALAKGKNIIVIQLDDVVLTPGMELQFGLYQMVNKKNYLANENFIAEIGAASGKDVGYDEY